MEKTLTWKANPRVPSNLEPAYEVLNRLISPNVAPLIATFDCPSPRVIVSVP
jgi:hypothetical protein